MTVLTLEKLTDVDVEGGVDDVKVTVGGLNRPGTLQQARHNSEQRVTVEGAVLGTRNIPPAICTISCCLRVVMVTKHGYHGN